MGGPDEKILEQRNVIGLINMATDDYEDKVDGITSTTILGLERRMTEAENTIKEISSYLKQYYEGA